MRAIEQLGPAYVKVAQALSTRVDLLPPAYLIAIQRLQVTCLPARLPACLAHTSTQRCCLLMLGGFHICCCQERSANS